MVMHKLREFGFSTNFIDTTSLGGNSALAQECKQQVSDEYFGRSVAIGLLWRIGVLKSVKSVAFNL